LKKKVGPKHTYAERLLMNQVAAEFTKKWKELGTAKKASKELGIKFKSFYKYAAGTDLPRIEVLRSASIKWGIKWDLIDTSALFRAAKPISAEQLLLPLIRSVREEDVEVIEVMPAGDSSLRVMLRIRFTAENSSPTTKHPAQAKR
jgi:hypothetical protein